MRGGPLVIALRLTADIGGPNVAVRQAKPRLMD